jgi:hypothetical protein
MITRLSSVIRPEGQVAATGDIDHFRNAAGAAVHVVDEGVDTGPIVRRGRLADSFGASSIWECKARSFILGFDLLRLFEVNRGQVAARLPDVIAAV